jgi:hypothetical protein
VKREKKISRSLLHPSAGGGIVSKGKSNEDGKSKERENVGGTSQETKETSRDNNSHSSKGRYIYTKLCVCANV